MVNIPPGAEPSKIYVIIVAAGTGNRFGGNLPKQFALLAGRPVLMRAIEAFSAIDCEKEIIVVLSESEISRWFKICEDFGFKSPGIVAGGASRTESVRNALSALKVDPSDRNALILIHDGARPLVDENTIKAVIGRLMDGKVDAAIPCTSITDSIMTADYDDSAAVDRSTIVAVQTPQGFRAGTLLKAYSEMEKDAVMTDDASVVSKYAGAKVHLVEGSRTNIKITYPVDLHIAEMILSDKGLF